VASVQDRIGSRFLPFAAYLQRLKTLLSELAFRRAIALVVLLLSFGVHVFALLITRGGNGEQPPDYQIIYRALLLGSLVLEVGAFLVKRIAVFRILHLLRFLLVCLVAGILEGCYFSVTILLSMLLLVETSLYEKLLPSVGENAGFIAVLFAILMTQEPAPGSAFAAEVPLVVLGAHVLVAWFASLFVQYRENVVSDSDEIKTLKLAIDNLSNANKQLQIYADNLESESTEKERNRITRELHDAVGYALTNVIIMMDAGKLLLRRSPEELSEMMEKIRSQTEQALNETRQILHRLRDVRSCRPEGLPAITHLIGCFQGATSIKVEFHPGNLPRSLGTRIDSALFRLVQEGLTNAFRHGKADHIRILFWAADGEIRISIWDNGRSKSAGAAIKEGIGLSGMRERFASLGGAIYPHFRPDGFELEATIPYKTGVALGRD